MTQPTASRARVTRARRECFTVNPVTPTLSTTAGDDVLPRQRGDGLGDAGRHGDPAGQPGHQPDRHRRRGSGWNDHLQAVRPERHRVRTVGLHVSRRGGLRQRHLRQPGPQFVPTAAGNYHWVAVYSGNLPNTNGVTHNAACTDTNEDVTVNTVPSSMTTAQTLGAERLGDDQRACGWRPRRARCRSRSSPTADCAAGTAALPTPTATVVGASPQTVSTSNTHRGRPAPVSFSWRVSYDSNNPAQRDIPASCHETSVADHRRTEVRSAVRNTDHRVVAPGVRCRLAGPAPRYRPCASRASAVAARLRSAASSTWRSKRPSSRWIRRARPPKAATRRIHSPEQPRRAVPGCQRAGSLPIARTGDVSHTASLRSHR